MCFLLNRYIVWFIWDIYLNLFSNCNIVKIWFIIKVVFCFNCGIVCFKCGSFFGFNKIVNCEYEYYGRLVYVRYNFFMLVYK